MDRYFQRVGGIRDYLSSVVEEARKVGYTETVMGRRRYLPDLMHDNRQRREIAERMALNAPIQGSAADIIRRAMARMPAALAEAKLSARMLLQVHDELVFECPEVEAEATCALAKQVMERAADPAVELSVPLVVEARAAKNWDEAH